jgi:hypothetical protein
MLPIFRNQNGILRSAGGGNRAWMKLCHDRDGSIYAAVLGAGIFRKQIDESVFTLYWASAGQISGVTVTPAGDLYVAVYGVSGTVLKQTARSGAFVDLVVRPAAFGWYSIFSAPDNAVYVEDNGGSIWRKESGSETFTNLNQTNRYWYGGECNDSDAFACAYGGLVYRQAGRTGDFVAVSTGNKNWWSMTTERNGNILAAAPGDGIYRSAAGTGTYTKIASAPASTWRGITVNTNDDFYGAVDASDIFKAVNGLGI